MNNYQVFIDNFVGSLGFFKPEIAIIATFISAILLDLMFKNIKNIAGYVSIVGFIITGVFLAQLSGQSASLFNGLIVVDPFSTFFKFIVLITSLLTVIMSFSYKELYEDNRKVGEYYSIIAGMTFGMFLLCSATNLISIYLAIETMSLSSYVLAGYTKEIKNASEASLKYVIYGAFSSGIMIYGMSILFGATGSMDVNTINKAILSGNVNLIPIIISGLMILVGFGYKISAVPFHYWTPDVYEGSPITITAFLSVASKAAGFAVFIRFFKDAYMYSSIDGGNIWQSLPGFDWKLVVAILSVASMTLGNFVALWQDNIKRMLAYSSIAHAGYLLMGVTVMTNAGIGSVMIYFVMYLIMNLGAFYVAQLIENEIHSDNINDYNGLGSRAPGLSVLMAIFMISLIGIPATAGFIGKLYIFTAVIEAGAIWLAVVGILNSVVSAFFYLKVVRNMFIRENATNKSKLRFHPATQVIAYALGALTIIFGLYFTPVLAWAQNSIQMFF
ncbi:MAG: NADH-quinone oxidoreductase subunit N [Chloroherpetonaceae bacterium]|nr:NADH-quinone oxidoreductase subunit N [bacterium]